jgi:hypothetical protein
MKRSAVPLLESVTVCAELEDPTVWLANTSADGVSAGTGAAPLPESGTVKTP